MARERPLREQARVIYALILRDTRTRYGRTWAGFVIMILWPLSHALFLMLGYYLVHRVAPIGADINIFVGTGVLPYVLCLYPARMTMLCLVQNQPLLTFPVVKTFDVILARGILEIIIAFWVVCLFCMILYVSDVDFFPRRSEEAMMAILATIYLGFSIGFFAAVLYKLLRAWNGIQIGLLILAYFTGGAFFVPTALPQWIRDILWFNPLLHAIEWLRAAYYEGYGDGMLSREYLLGYATVIMLLGLVAERGVRGRLQQVY
jgi:capsular polysaccharide transport system permease protein